MLLNNQLRNVNIFLIKFKNSCLTFNSHQYKCFSFVEEFIAVGRLVISEIFDRASQIRQVDNNYKEKRMERKLL